MFYANCDQADGLVRQYIAEKKHLTGFAAKNTEQLKYLLINFISVSLINRFYSNTETHTAKACLSYLNNPEFQSLTGLLEIDYIIQYKDLLGLVSKNRYKFYQKEGSIKYQINENMLNLATQHF